MERIRSDIIDILLAEYESHRTEIISMEGAIIRYLQLGLAFIGAILALGVRQSSDSQSSDILINLNTIFSFSPFLLFVFIMFFLIKFHNMMLHGAYLRNVEERINHSYGSNLLNWESSVFPNIFSKNTSTYFHLFVSLVVIVIGLYFMLSILAVYYYIPNFAILKKYSFFCGIMYFLFFPGVLYFFLSKMSKDYKDLPELIKNGFPKG